MRAAWPPAAPARSQRRKAIRTRTATTGTNHPSPSRRFIQVIAEGGGLVFKSKRDRKVVDVDPSAPPGDNSSRTELETGEYAQVVLYDHVTRRRS